MKKNENLNYIKWKSWGETFGQLKRGEISYFDAEISRTKSKFSKNSKVLEIGFGNGNFLQYAKINNWDIVGIEANQALVKIAGKKGFNVKHLEDISSFPNETFDLIVAFDVIEHIPQNLLPQFFLDVKKKLKDGGFLIARFPNGDSPIGQKNPSFKN
jgi:cyclopropane fatty-acyl-phospholipid synthase-like methyltransferase